MKNSKRPQLCINKIYLHQVDKTTKELKFVKENRFLAISTNHGFALLPQMSKYIRKEKSEKISLYRKNIIVVVLFISETEYGW